MKGSGWVLALSLAAPVPADAQRVEKGSTADLVAATTVYVDTTADSDVRSRLVAALARELPTLRLLDRSDDAQLVVRFAITSTQGKAAPQQVPEIGPRPRPPGGSQPRMLSRRVGPTPVELDNRGQVLLPDPSRASTGDDDEGAFENEPRITTYATGEVLKPAGGEAFRKAFDFVRRVDGRTRLTTVDDFVRAFAKQFRKANEKRPR
jgi:hypothetical protein